jgi:hypothetical protein
MPARLDESRTTIIANAIVNDNFAVGSPAWLENHHIEKDEWDAFLDYPTRLARMYEWREANMDVGSVEVSLTFATHSGKVGSDEEKWTCFAPQADTARILRVAESGKVVAQLFPEQMPLPLEGVGMVDLETGELV